MADTITLPARLDLPAAVQLTFDLRAVEGAIHLDGSAVTHLGALGLQTLVAASRSAKAQDVSFEISNSSEQLIAHMEIMGVTLKQLQEGDI